ncbi:cytochrome c oxidase assembly protein [Streptomyces albogriseolus]
MAHSPVAGWLLCPPVAAVVDIGGLWALYRTDLWSAAHRHPVLGGLLELHMLLAGLLFAMAVCAVDPVRRRSGLPLRAVTLLAAGAAHAVLAKSLYAAGPPGTAFAPPDLRSGAQLMYYGGDAVEVLLALTLAVQWYVTTGRRRAREAVRSARVGSPSGTGAHAGPAARGGPPREPFGLRVPPGDHPLRDLVVVAGRRHGSPARVRLGRWAACPALLGTWPCLAGMVWRHPPSPRTRLPATGGCCVALLDGWGGMRSPARPCAPRGSSRGPGAAAQAGTYGGHHSRPHVRGPGRWHGLPERRNRRPRGRRSV